MKISTLLLREPFAEIFEKTLASFLEDITKRPHTVKWGAKIKFKKKLTSTQKWHCNPLINSIFVNGANQKIFNSINAEYAKNPLKPWRNLIQRAYLYLAQNKFTYPILSKYVIEVSPPVNEPKNKLIIGGNNKIRLIDIDKQIVYVILKYGFDRSYIDREVYVRKKFKHLDIPKIYQKGNTAIWYSEEYITGTPPNRLDFNTGIEALNKAVTGIHDMLKITKMEHRLIEYVSQLEQRIYFGLKHVKHLDKREMNKMKYFIKTLLKELKKYSDRKIFTAYCHGDFHQGNILIDGDKNWILDWENSGQKQIGYDLLILLIESRIANGFFKRFLKIFNSEFEPFQQNLINNWPNLNWNNKDSKKITLLLFLLEDIDFHVFENNNSIFYINSKNFNERNSELEKCFNLLIK